MPLRVGTVLIMELRRRSTLPESERDAKQQEWWAQLPQTFAKQTGRELTPAAVAAARSEAGPSIHAMFEKYGVEDQPYSHLEGYRNAVFHVLHTAALEQAGLGHEARKEARKAEPGRRADAGLRVGMITLECLEAVDGTIRGTDLTYAAPGIERISQLPQCDARSLLHADATARVVTELADHAGVEPGEVFASLDKPAHAGGWGAASQLLLDVDPPDSGVVAAMRAQYAHVDSLHKPIPAPTQLSQLGDTSREAGLYGWNAAQAGIAAVRELREEGQQHLSPGRQTAALDPSAGLADAAGATNPSSDGTRATAGSGAYNGTTHDRGTPHIL